MTDADTHSPLSTVLRLHAPKAIIYQLAMALKKHQGSYLELFTVMLFYMCDNDGNSSRIDS